MIEIWKEIPEYDGMYSVSNTGKVVKNKGQKKGLLHVGKNKCGYNTTRLTTLNKKRITRGIHRLVAETFIPNPENLPCVNHINGIKTDNRVENLEWCTQKENVNHFMRLNPDWKNRKWKNMGEVIIKKIINLHKKGLNNSEIGRIVNKRPSTISRIVSGKTPYWRYLLIFFFILFVNISYSQVLIPNNVAKFFLEQNDKVKLLEKQVKIKESIINKKDSIIVHQLVIIDSYKGDSTKYEQMLANKDSILINKNAEIKILAMSLNQTKLQRDIAVCTGAGALIGTAVGQPLIGAGIGAGVAIIRRIFKK